MQDEERTIAELIEELRVLRLRETIIIAEIEATNESRSRATRADSDYEHIDIEGEPIVNGLRKGDRVRITNKIRKPATATSDWTERKERAATVTKVTREQIHVITDNGTKTWRGPNNVRKEA